MMHRILQAGLVLTLLLGMSVAVSATSGDDAARVQWVLPGQAVLKSSYGIDALYLSGSAYRELEEETLRVSLTVVGLRVKERVSRLVDGYWVRRIELAPAAGGTRVTVSRAACARGLAVAVSPGSRLMPGISSVVLSLTAGAAPERVPNNAGLENESPGGVGAVEANPDYPVIPVAAVEPGRYRFPPSKRKYKYSDVLVDLNLVNTDFRQVLMLMSEIGNVSIVFDPYWNDAPTGGRRRPGGPGAPGGGGEGGGEGGGGEGPGGPGGGGADGEGQGGFREAGTFQVQLPQPGTGNLTMNLQGVPFDLALDLILTAVNLEKIDIYPGFFGQPVAGVDEPERGQAR